MVFGTLYYQGFAKKPRDKDNGKDKPKEIDGVDTEQGALDETTALLSKVEVLPEKP